MTFDEAFNVFKDKSIDLLHIDGLHTYDAVKRDFKTWLPKLSDRSVVIIHDTTVKEEGYGVWKFWEEISNDYLSFSFEHGYGLGILVVGNKVSPSFVRFVDDANKHSLFKYLFQNLGKLIYLEEKEPKTKLFIDCGKGFNEALSIVKASNISEEFIQLDFDLSHFHHIISLRWDPLKNTWCIVKLKSITYQDKIGNRHLLDLNKVTHNGKTSEDSMMTTFIRKLYRTGWLIFENIDPQIYLPIQGELQSLSIESKIEIIDQTHIDHLYRKKDQIIKDLNSDLQTQHHMSFNAPYCIKKYFQMLKIIPKRIIDFLRKFFVESLKKFYNKAILVMPHIFMRGIKVARHEGLNVFFSALINYFKIKKDIFFFPNKPRFSIIMPVHNVERRWLEWAINSVKNQYYTKWELCIVDDASTAKHIKDTLSKYVTQCHKIKVKFQEKNQGVSATSNIAVRMSSGEYLAFMDHDDELTPDAIYEIVKVINRKNVDIIYSDEDLTNSDGGHIISHFKPDLSPDLLLSHNYITHLLVVRKTLFDKIGGFRSEYDGAQDYDLILRLSEKSNKIHHIPKILYHWRQHPASVSINSESKPLAVNAGLAALQATLVRRHFQAKAEVINSLGFYRVRRKCPNESLISIIIPFRDQSQLLKTCIDSILNKTTFQNYELICINNGSSEQKTFEVIKHFQKKDNRLKFIEFNAPFNFSKINNYGVSLAKGDHIVLMNNDIEIISTDWLEVLLEHSQRKEIGAVGGKLFYPNDTIQHAGVIVGIGGNAGHSHKHFKREANGYFYRLRCIQNVSAVTGALLMVKKYLFQLAGGLDEEYFTIALNDIDFCLKLRNLGYLNIFTPFCEAYHHESASRGYENTPEKKYRFKIETSHFREKWKDILEKGDPYYNPNLTLEKEDFSVRS